MSSRVRINATLPTLSWVVLLLASCSEAPPSRPEPDPAPAVNPVKPNANARILAQTMFGDPTRRSSIAEMSVPGVSGHAFRGVHDGYAAVGRLGSGGDLRWSTRLPYSLRDVLPLGSSAPIANGVVVVGSHDTDGDGSSEIGLVWLLTEDGTMVETRVFSSDTSDVWLNEAAAVSESLFVVVGGERTAGRANPFLATVALTAGGKLERRAHAVLATMANRRFVAVVPDPAGPSGGRLSLFVTSSVDAGVNGSFAIHRVTVDFPSLLSPTLDWSIEIPGAGPSCSANDLRASGGDLYVCGGSDDASKPPPANGGYWRSGMAARLTLAGDLVWSRVVRLSDRSEDLDALVLAPDGVYCLGNGARFLIVGTEETLGYGWIAKLSPETGDVLFHFTLGDIGFQSGLHSGHYEGGRIRCGGWTRGEIQGGPNQAWYCEVDVSGTKELTTPTHATKATSTGRFRDQPRPDTHR